MGKATVQGWIDDRAASMGAALSYYTFFSMAPLLLIVISLAGLLLGREAAQGHLMDELVGLFGQQAAASIQAMVASAREPAESWWGTVVGLGAMLVGATTVFAELQGALDRIWEAPDRPAGTGLWGLLRARVLSFGLILGLAFLLMVSLVVGAVVTALGRWWSSALGSWEWVAQGLNFGVGYLLTSVIFAMIYKLMPRAHVQWKDVWVGAVVTSLLFSVGKFLIGLYLGATGIASAYGAAGSIVVVLVWVYYSAQVFLLGAEFTWVYAQARGSRSGQNRPV
nr:YihY/virulence factor BrkB family protein [Hydrogenophaga crassostreae]